MITEKKPLPIVYKFKLTNMPDIQFIEKSYMISPIKAIPAQEQDQHDRLSSKPSLPLVDQSKVYAKRSRKRASTQGNGTLKTVLLIMFLIACLFVMTVRYLELKGKEAGSQFSYEQTQAYDQSLDQSKKIKQVDEFVGQHKSIIPHEENTHLNDNFEPQHLQQSQSDHSQPSGYQKPPVSQDSSSTNQNSPQLKTSSLDLIVNMAQEENNQIDSDEGEVDGQIDDSANEELDKNGAKSIEEVELLNGKDQENVDQVNNDVRGEFELHPRVKVFEGSSQSAESKNDEKREQNFENLNTQSNQIATKPSGQQQQQKTNKPNENRQIEKNNQEAQNNDRKSLKPSSPSQPQQQPSKTPLQLSQQDLYDPIIRVKDKMEENFKTKFEDLIYIKAGTKITESQYYKARERMSIWKFFNPATGNLQLLDEVKYDPSVTLTPQSTQLAISNIKKVIKQEQEQYQQKYNVSHYQQIPFCIIIPSYKNQDKYLRNLNSILQQDYQNYHIVYIDDASQDGTADKVREYIKKYNVSERRLNFIQNQVNKKALPNIDYAARRLCQSGEIMAIIDGDDYLIGTQVFKLINARYQQQNLLALYTNHLRVHQPIYLKVGTCIDYPERVKKSRSYRRFSIFPASHLRTFYVDLYWRINIRDLKDYKGQYFTAANDFAIMMPILQMAGQKFQYLPQLTYVYDAGTGFNNFQTKADTQAKNFKITKRRHRYPKLVRQLELEKRYGGKEANRFDSSGLALEEEKAPGYKLREVVRAG